MFFRIFGLLGALLTFCHAFAADVRISIAASGDLHGHTAVIASCIKPALAEIQRRDGVAPIYCDLGDIAEGNFALMRSRGAGMTKELNQAGAAVWIPGNHDASFGLASFANAMREFKGTVLAANLHFPEARSAFKPYVIVERGGYRIALIGLMLKDMNGTLPLPESRFQTLAAVDTLPAVLAEVRKFRPDAVVLLRHAGIYGGGENLSDVLAAAPGIDLVIGAHTHRADPGHAVRSSWFVQPGAHGESLALATLIFDAKTRKLKQIESQLVELPATPASDPELAKSAPVLTAEPDNFPALQMQKALGADAALYAVESPEAWRKLRTNPAPTVGDYFDVFSYFDPVICVNVSAAELKAILEEYALFARERKSFLTFAGGTYSLKHGKLDRFQPDKNLPQYRLAVTAYAAAGAGGKLPTTKAILKARITPEALDNAPPVLELLLSK